MGFESDVLRTLIQCLEELPELLVRILELQLEEYIGPSGIIIA